MARSAMEDMTAALAAWPVAVQSATRMSGGWNSTTWLVRTPSGRYVAKLVDHVDAVDLMCGLRLAEFASARGLACGAPVRTAEGELTIAFADGVLALLAFVPGRAPDLSVPEQVRRAGGVLARAHQVLARYPAGDEPRYRWPWEWVPRCLDTIAMPTQVNEAARAAWREIVRNVGEHELSISLIHADPGPDGFLLSSEDSRSDAIIDWATALRGPLLYDLASFAVITKEVGPDAVGWLTEGYLRQMPRIARELPCLPAMTKARWLANAIYFASRIERGITRGSDSPTANDEGLAAAYEGLTAQT